MGVDIHENPLYNSKASCERERLQTCKYGILAQLGEHLPYKQRVIGSSPIGPIDYGWIPEWPKGADCKSVGTAFEGSNPSPPTKPYHWLSRCGSIGRAADL